ncbi:MAG: putative baseplate assembly protein [Candidatus Nitricoxidivorans perseverans]|uniref:Baseplate assembly protein n=1 Tax=Candidatus Nitricoxidivorans perseverans TaxID=2975601 RepID=A0AA49FJP6_9PROT|nr:MAG: putative baseplate assembly protein [Candidatus Nitricoxidivorans perseverans]
MKYYCCDRRRCEVVKLSGTLNGLEYLEVHDSGLSGDPTRQLTLFVKFLRPVPALGKDQFRIEGGERIASVDIEWIAVADALPPGEPSSLVDGLAPLNEFLVIRTKIYGDFSVYTLRLVSGPGSDTPPAGFDPRLSEIQFSFKVQCASDFDCAGVTPCPTPPAADPRLDYLAKDYASFRRLMLDRMSALMPDWDSRNAADTGVTLVELLAYVGDQLSYQQDAVATEAYLGTARKRTSLRRHARLVDYLVHEGCNARAWVRLFVNDDGVMIPRGTPLLTRAPNAPDRIVPNGDQLRDALASGALVFETVEDAVLYQQHERISLYSWGERECCLPKGATRATLAGHYPKLKAGDVLVFAEELGPRTGLAEDADRTHRWAVRLADVRLDSDPCGGLFLAVPGNDPVDVTEICWADEDALPFPLCLSTTTDADHGATYLEEVSAAYGNIVLADHGRTLTDEDIGAVPATQLALAAIGDTLSCKRPPLLTVPPRFRPRLSERPLTHASTVEYGQSARQTMVGDPRRARPVISLASHYEGMPDTWLPRRDLLGSDAAATEFVVESEHDGSAWLRFGDDCHGKRPDSGTAFSATYRIGNGTAGNIGLESIAHIVSNDARLLRATNPLPAQGGSDPENAEDVRRDAPEAFRTQERAVTPEDYAEVAERHPSVQRAAATFRWTGSWHTAFLTIDRKGGGEVDAAYEQTIRDHVERYRMAGYDLEVDGPRYVPLLLEMTVCVKPDYFRADVRAALMRVFGRGWLEDGTPALFHPDNFTFGQPVYLSKLYEAAQAVQGVASVVIDTFRRLRAPADSKPLDDGVLAVGRLEIARLDNDPNFPERGVLKLTTGGGK